MKLSKSVRDVEAGGGLSPKLLAVALAQAGLLATVFSMPVCAATLIEPTKAAGAPVLEPLLYIAQAPTGYGTLNGGSSTGTTQSGTTSGTATTPTRPQGSGTPAPKPAPAPDGRNSTR
jgi:hypothetical protein